MKVWITKFALTSGILEKEAEICHNVNEDMIKVTGETNKLGEYYHGKDWHTSLETAQLRAEQMRAAKIANIEKQLKKLKSIKF